MKTSQHHSTANSKAIVSAIKFFAALVVIASVAYSEILFLGIIGNLFPTSGPLAIGAMIGAVTTGMSILALCIAKSHWFRPGMQLVVAWTFTLIEIAVLIMNDILAYQLHTGATLDQFMEAWKTFCVAAPVLSLVGWVLLFYFSPERAIQHKQMEMEDDQAKAKIELDSMAHGKAMEFHYRAISMVATGMEAQMERLMPHYTEMAARQKLAEIASDLTGRHVSHSELGAAPTAKQLPPPGKIIDADKSKLVYASKDQVLDPHEVKPEVDAEPKKMPKLSLADRIWAVRDKIDEKLDGERIETVEEQSPVEQETIEEELPENYLDWTDAQWKQARKQLTEEQYNELFDEVFPADGLKPTPKKRTGGKKSGKVSRREVLGMEKQEG